MTTVMDRKSNDNSTIAGFYSGRSIFVTGGTGFMGKVLIEKLLRSCPGIREIFMLMRPKRNMTIDDRLRKMIALPLFDRLREENPSAFEKLIPVQGDVTVEGLGLPAVERRVLIERVSVIFHVAANVRFIENFKKDIFCNTRSTRDVCILAGSMKNLVALVHVSSTYAHANKPMVDEIVYPAETDWKKTIKIAETVDDETLKMLTAKFLGTMPNTYVFSKNLAEQVIQDYSKDLPCVIFRPSIVISTFKEPVVGWVDNFNGPVGMLIGGGKGILRALYADPLACGDYFPVDAAICAMLLVAWKRGRETITRNPELAVYNCCAAKVKTIVFRELVHMALSIEATYPLEGILWCPDTILTTSRLYHYVLTILLHLLPALVIDGILLLSGKRPILCNLQQKIYASSSALSFFVTHQWCFENNKLLQIFLEVPPSENDDFSFAYDTVDIQKYFTNALIGAKKYLLHEDMGNLERARQHYARMWWLDRILKIWLYIVLAWILARVGFFSYMLDMYHSVTSGSMFDDL